MAYEEIYLKLLFFFQTIEEPSSFHFFQYLDN